MTALARDPLLVKRQAVLLGLAAALLLACLAAAAFGAVDIPLTHILAPATPVEKAALFAIRLPRLALGIGVGAMLGLAGATLQSLFRNPLADPVLIGISGGSACGAVGWIVLGAAAPGWMQGALSLPLAAFSTGLTATAGVYAIARTRSRTDIATLLLAGMAVNALCSAIVGYLTFRGTDLQLRSLTFWLMGGLGGVTWSQIWPALLLMAVAAAGLRLMARRYDLLALGDSVGSHLGLDVEATRRATVLLAALGVGAAVALTGAIGFVGLVAPHLVRLAGGAAHRFVLPGSALLGALLLVLADLVSRVIVVPAELPVGMVTSALGAPFFIWLLRRRIGQSS